RHAYAGRSDQPLIVTAEVNEANFEVVLRHEGERFAPAPGQAAAPTSPREGGLGLFIIRQFADEIDYNTDGFGYACTRLVKRLDRAS
ncbi:MAG: ATP-binding protein, partial [Candidatus Acidiferrum sp.]